MAEEHDMAPTVGIARVYLAAGDRLPGLTWKQRLFSRPLFEVLIDRARQAGLWATTAKGMVYGFSYASKAMATFHADAGFVNTHIFVELIAPRERLERFLQEVAPLITGRAVTYSEVQDWTRTVPPAAPALPS